MINPDKFILESERIMREDDRVYFEEDVQGFCIAALGKAQPTTADAEYGKKLMLNSLAMRARDGVVECSMPGCEVKVDVTDLKVIEGACAVAELCLKTVWEDKQLFVDDYLKHGRQPNPNWPSYACKRPGCEYSCGWSEDGAPGSVGKCIDKH